jgi:hypothetical protein
MSRSVEAAAADSPHTTVELLADFSRLEIALLGRVCRVVANVDDDERLLGWRGREVWSVSPGVHRVSVACRWFKRFESRRAAVTLAVPVGQVKHLWVRTGDVAGSALVIDDHQRGEYRW